MDSPISKFNEWFDEARAHPGIKDATAMTLATAAVDGTPAARIVLLKGHCAESFVFYGNMESRKFQELMVNPKAALVFYWAALDRQVRIEGSVVRVTDTEANDYFATRERGKQIGAWASQQSRTLTNREELVGRIADVTMKYEGSDVPRPPYWSGWRLVPTVIEFWSQGESRLHERNVYSRDHKDAPWRHRLLYP
ncbi:MAG: pyridoxamine 5'-phosphate oxidase [Rickettsiales bacterium]